ncbi:MAG TPA: hypothetical protein ENO21_02890 [Firmicutes bacterium]|nr:hypothetical protein [Bacillota bacterium]
MLSTTAAWADEGFTTGPFGAPGAAEEVEDEPFIPEAPWSPGDSAWEEYYVQHIDIAGFMQRLKVILTSEEHLGGFPEVAEVARMMDAMGYFDIAGGFNEYEISGDSIKLRSLSEYNHSGDTFFSRYMAVEDAPLRSAKYVAEGDYLLYFALNNVIDKALTMLSLPEYMGEEGMAGEELMMELEMEELGQAMAMVQAMKLDVLLSDTLSGEIALVVYEAPSVEQIFTGDIMPQDVHAALMIGIEDPEYVLNMANQFGPDLGLVPAEAPEGWHAFTMMGEESIGVAFNDEILIATPDWLTTATRVQSALDNGGMELDPCLMHMDLDVEALHEQLIHPLALAGIGEMGLEVEDLPTDAMAYLLNMPEADALGHMTATVNHPEGNAYFEFEMKKAVLQYLLFYIGVGMCGAGQAGMLH